MSLSAQPHVGLPPSSSLRRLSRRPLQCMATADAGPGPGLRQATVHMAGWLAAAAVVLAAPDALAAPRPAAPPLPPLQEVLELPSNDTVYELDGKLLFNPMAYSGRWYEVRWRLVTAVSSPALKWQAGGFPGLRRACVDRFSLSTSCIPLHRASLPV